MRIDVASSLFLPWKSMYLKGNQFILLCEIPRLDPFWVGPIPGFPIILLDPMQIEGVGVGRGTFILHDCSAHVRLSLG